MFSMQIKTKMWFKINDIKMHNLNDKLVSTTFHEV